MSQLLEHRMSTAEKELKALGTRVKNLEMYAAWIGGFGGALTVLYQIFKEVLHK